MNTIRMILVALPMMLLLACGGGGSSGTAAVAPTPMNTPDPMNPPTTMPDPMPPTITLPGYAVNAATARTAVGGTAPTSMTETQIVSAIQTRATAADTFEFSDLGSISVTCTNNSSCSGNVPDVGSLTFSLTGIEDLSLVDDTDLVGFDSDTQLVMEDRGVTVIQSQAAAGQNDGTHLAFQTYGGWLTNSVFGVGSLEVMEDGTPTTRYASFSFGDATGSNPTGTLAVQWTGVMVGTDTTTGHVIHGDALIQYLPSSANFLDNVNFSNVKNLNNGNEVIFEDTNQLQFLSIPLTNGIFESTSGDIKGSFYGTDHGEVGGIFNSGTHNIIGAFGGTKQ